MDVVDAFKTGRRGTEARRPRGQLPRRRLALRGRGREPNFVAPSYSILGLLLLAAGARAPRDLAHALVSAARRDCQRVLDLGAPSESFAHAHRSELVKRLFAHDFGRTDRRELVREPFGPREAQLCAKVAEGALTVGTGDEDVPPWFPSQKDVAPRLAVSGVDEDACAPWCGAPTLFALAERRETAPYAPPPRPALSTHLPALGGLEVLDFAPTAAEVEAEDEEPPAPPDLRREAPDALETLGHMGYEPAAAKRALAAARGDFSKAVRALERECRRASGADPVLDAATGGQASAAVPPSLADDQSARARRGQLQAGAGAAAGRTARVPAERVARAQGGLRAAPAANPRDADEAAMIADLPGLFARRSR